MASGQQQKRLERKRQRRDRRLQKSSLTRPPAISSSDRPKMSEVLVAFARPLLDRVPERAELWHAALSLAGEIWNVVQDGDSLAALHADSRILAQSAQLAEQACVSLNEVTTAIDELYERKAAQFPDDDRQILRVHTTDMDGHVYVQAGYLWVE